MLQRLALVGEEMYDIFLMFSEMLFFSKLVYLSSSDLLCSEICSLPSKYPQLNKSNNLVNGV